MRAYFPIAPVSAMASVSEEDKHFPVCSRARECSALRFKQNLGFPDRTEDRGQKDMDRTRQDRGHDRTGQDRAGDMTGHDRTGQDRG